MYYKFWGKTEAGEYHLLAYHGLDACSVAQEWLDCNRRAKRALASENCSTYLLESPLGTMVCLQSRMSRNLIHVSVNRTGNRQKGTWMTFYR